MGLVSDLVQIGIPARQAPFLGHTSALAGEDLTGTNQATAFPITETITLFSGGTAGTAFCAIMPSASTVPQTVYYIRNSSGITLRLFPAVGESLNVLAVNTQFDIADGRGLIVVKHAPTRWLVFGSAS